MLHFELLLGPQSSQASFFIPSSIRRKKRFIHCLLLCSGEQIANGSLYIYIRGKSDRLTRSYRYNIYYKRTVLYVRACDEIRRTTEDVCQREPRDKREPLARSLIIRFFYESSLSFVETIISTILTSTSKDSSPRSYRVYFYIESGEFVTSFDSNSLLKFATFLYFSSGGFSSFLIKSSVYIGSSRLLHIAAMLLIIYHCDILYTCYKMYTHDFL